MLARSINASVFGWAELGRGRRGGIEDVDDGLRRQLIGDSGGLRLFGGDPGSGTRDGDR
jgi:hypothetical protein